MKRDFHFSFYSRLFVLALFGLGAFILLQQVETRAEIDPVADFEFGGWAWSPNMGWLSMNCYNDFDGDGVLENSCLSGDEGGLADYNLELAVNGDVREVRGCAWAGNIGWYLCFSDPCLEREESRCTEAPADGIPLNGPIGSNKYYNSPPVGLDPPKNQVINTLCHDENEISNCRPSILFYEDPGDVWTHEIGFPIGVPGPPSPSLEVNGCFNCRTIETKQCAIEGISCDDDEDCIEEENDTCVVTNVEYECDNCLQYNYTAEGVLDSVLGGYNCDSCNNFDDTITCQANAYQQNSNTCWCQYTFETPGVMVDYTLDANNQGSMCGWAWHAYYCYESQCPDNAGYYGVGWIQFAPRITTSTTPYFAVESGNIYSKGNIVSQYPPPFNKYNAYIIESSGDTIQNLRSYSDDPGFAGILRDRPDIDFPTELIEDTGQYQNILGKIDVNGLITKVGSTEKNKYGMVVKGVGTSDWNIIQIGGNLTLANKVFYWEGDTSVAASSLEIFNGGGPGTIVIDGNLTIKNNITYSAHDVKTLKELASLVWIVKGDITLDADLVTLAGTFIALGDGTSCENEPDIGCGNFITGEGSPLTVYGGVLAKEFELGRRSIGGEPSEKFINDGRLQINPPLGLADPSKSLPDFNYNQ